MQLATKPTPKCSQGRTYWMGCRCEHCTRTATRLKAETRYRRMQRDRGLLFDSDLIDAAECRRLLRLAKKRGLSYSEISRLSGIPRLTVLNLANHKRDKCRRITARLLINAVSDPDNRATLPKSFVPNAWTKQMIKSLSAQGWSTLHQAEIIQNNRGHAAGFIRSMGSRTQATSVLKSSEDEMKWLVRAIGDKEGPSNIAKAKMRSRGIFPTKHYDGVGKLIYGSLSPEQKAIYDSVR